MNVLEKLVMDDKVLKVINKMDDLDLIKLHNNYCYKLNLPYDVIYSMAEFNDFMKDKSPLEIASKICNGIFSPTDDYFMIDCDGSLDSSVDVLKYIDRGELAAYIVDKKDSLDNYEIYCLLDKYYGYTHTIK